MTRTVDGNSDEESYVRPIAMLRTVEHRHRPLPGIPPSLKLTEVQLLLRDVPLLTLASVGSVLPGIAGVPRP